MQFSVTFSFGPLRCSSQLQLKTQSVCILWTYGSHTGFLALEFGLDFYCKTMFFHT
jgi:hypothetical protein